MVGELPAARRAMHPSVASMVDAGMPGTSQLKQPAVTEARQPEFRAATRRGRASP
ncbi:hypothetical protein GXW82_00055 [Streptacidiphilus sp. 4-A2]|nr:hypothetical protein [Streptacidiphilus sp. 4-A2]